MYNYLKDSNKMVVIASINALNEIMIEEGGIAINGKIVIYLLGRINVPPFYGRSSTSTDKPSSSNSPPSTSPRTRTNS